MGRVDQAIAVRHLDVLLRAGTVGGLTDAELLERFADRPNAVAESAFGALVSRHGAMVHRVCRAVLRDSHAADDAFQATFLVLARRAGSLWVRDSLGPWLYQTAYRTASRARSAAARRRRHEGRAAERTARAVDEPGRDDLEGVIHEEVDRLPQRYRAAVVLCLMEGRTPEQAARSLGCPVGTVHSRLARGRARLRSRLTGRGVTVPAAFLAASISRSATAAIAPAMADAAVQTAMRAGVNPGVPAGITSFIVDFIIRRSTSNALRLTAAVVLSVGLVTTGGALAPPQAEESKQETNKVAVAPDDQPGPTAAYPNSVMAVAFAPDGKTIAASTLDKAVTLWDATTGELRSTMNGTPGIVLKLAFSSGGETLAGVQNDGNLTLWNPKTGESKGDLDTLSDSMRQLAPSATGSAVAYSADGRWFATGGNSGPLSLMPTAAYQIRVFGTDPIRLIWEHIGRDAWVTSLAFSPDGKTLAHAGPIDGKVRLWDVETGDVKRTLKSDAFAVYAASYSSDGKLLAAGGSRYTRERAPEVGGGRTTIWDAVTGEKLRTVDGPPEGALTIAFAPGGHKIACGGVGRSQVPQGGYRPHGEVRLWDADSGALRWTWKGSDMGGVTSLAFAPDGKTLAACDRGGFSLIDATTGKTTRDLLKTPRRVR
jgi:RNA polymerase sigma factor (sigma-70 family)